MVEDDYNVADDLASNLQSRRVNVIGPVGQVDIALSLVKSAPRIDGALLDVDIHGTMVFPVADALLASDIPFVFTTGFDPAIVPRRFSNISCWRKPIDYSLIPPLLSQWVSPSANSFGPGRP